MFSKIATFDKDPKHNSKIDAKSTPNLPKIDQISTPNHEKSFKNVNSNEDATKNRRNCEIFGFRMPKM